MKIGYYLGNVSLNSGGTSPYAWRVLELLLSNNEVSRTKILILCNKESQENCIDLIDKYRANANVILLPRKFNLFQRLGRISGVVLSKMLNKLKISNKLDLLFDPSYRWFASLDIDLLHVPYQTTPVYDLPYPFIVTMHDVQELHFPEFFTPEARAYRAIYYWKSLKNASSVIVSFDHVKQDLVRYFHLSESKVHVCSLPYNQIKLSHPTQEEEKPYRKKYGESKDFVLYPAQTWEHKNHLSLIKALELIKIQNQRSINLICTGKKNNFYNEVINAYLARSTVAQQVNFTDLVPETELYWLYKNCALVVVPTLYEAGSFPLLEAMSLGAPVICSNVTSLPETIGDSRFVFEPLNVEQIADLIVTMLDDSEMIKLNIKNSQQRVTELNKVNSIDGFMNVYSNTIHSKSDQLLLSRD